MKQLTITLFLALLSISLFAQEAPQIPVLLSQTTLGKNISYASRDRVDRQILAAIEGGNTINNQFSVFVIQPALDLYDQGKIEGLKTQQTVKVNLQLKLTNIMTGEVLSVQELKASGAGNNQDEAINRALQSIRRDNPALSKAITTFRQEIAAHYQAQCANVLSAASEMAAQKKYREAFALLHSVPQGVACFQEVASKKLEYFDQVQKAECQNKMSRANASVAANDFRSALQSLSQIDANAPCFNEAKASIAGLETKVDENLKTNYEWLFAFYKEGKAAETARWNAMTALGLMYLSENKKCVLVQH